MESVSNRGASVFMEHTMAGLRFLLYCRISQLSPFLSLQGCGQEGTALKDIPLANLKMGDMETKN